MYRHVEAPYCPWLHSVTILLIHLKFLKKKYGLSLEKDQTLFLYEISFLATQTIFFLEYFSPQTFSGSEGHFLHTMVP